ncbi:B12-binding domain-containing radical SAM protein [Streptomyces silvensis]|uniref:Radical SAM protein n=1 Tax=Streptomyces silvensis TaxID=1765722 RepID=A0A0W7X956_9ACTN|nr:radical SAM protein [Streptomyces silvensis]KUF19344.1 radical SAM protein [Streptomyces silvensis]
MTRTVPHAPVLVERPSVKFSSAPQRPPLRHLGVASLRTSRSGTRRRSRGEAPRVLLLVPSYTRVVEPSPPGSSFQELGLGTFEVMKRAGTPIGLLRIAANARLGGFDVRIVDSPFAGWEQERRHVDLGGGSSLVRYGLDDAQLRALIEDFDPDVVGIQCIYTVQWGNARALADLVKDIDPGIVTVTGGAHPSGDWQYAVPDSPFDHVVVNEADQTFTALLRALTEEGGDIDAVPGIAYRRADGAVVRTSAVSPYMRILPKRQGLDQRLGMMPLPDFGMLDMRQYEQGYHSSGKRVRDHGAWAQIFSTIGCNVGCDFCYIPMVNGPWRALGTDWFDLHLAEIRKQGVTEVLIEDDHLLHDPLYAMETFKLLRKHDLPWVEEGGLSLFNLVLLHLGNKFADSMDDSERRNPNFRNVLAAMRAGLTCRDLIKAMAAGGCYSVYLAVESANEDSLVESGKPRLNAFQKATGEIVEMFTEYGIQVTGGFMLGFVNPPERPGGEPYVESLDQIEKTIDYAVTLMGHGMAYANPFIVTPLPGTKMWDFQKDYVVRNYDNGWSHEKATMATDKWSAEDIERMRLELLVRANGAERVVEMVRRGTWPVDA